MNRPPQPGRTQLSTRFLLYYAVTYLVLIGTLGWFVERQVRSALVDDLITSMESVAEVARLDMPDSPSELEAWASDVFQASGFRVTAISLEGEVLADSHSDPSVMENHGDRPEVVQAFSGEVGRSFRVSGSTGFAQHYLALPPQDGIVIRVAVAEAAVVERLGPFRWGIFSTFVVVGLVGIGVVALLATRLARPIARIRDTTLRIARGRLQELPQRSSARVLDELGLSITPLAEDLGERLAQAELASDTLEIVLGALPQGTVLVGPGEDIEYHNRRARELLGAVPAHLNALTPHPFQTIVRECLQTGAKEEVVVDHGAPPRRLQGMATPFAGEQRVLLVVIDVTDRERVASIRRDFVANASHELKTPVSSIIASAEALTMAVERSDDSAIGFARTIDSAARQLDRLVSDLLDLSRLERDEPELDRVRLDLLVSEEAARFADQAEEAGIELSVETTSMTVMGNWRDLSMAVRNLLDNAIRYTSDGGSVSVRARVDEGHAVVEVEDTGSGIPTRDLDRIFERFYRVDAARSRRTGGTGLGLSIVRHVIESHGGSVSASSQLDVGSTFSLTLPLAD